MLSIQRQRQRDRDPSPTSFPTGQHGVGRDGILPRAGSVTAPLWSLLTWGPQEHTVGHRAKNRSSGESAPPDTDSCSRSRETGQEVRDRDTTSHESAGPHQPGERAPGQCQIQCQIWYRWSADAHFLPPSAPLQGNILESKPAFQLPLALLTSLISPRALAAGPWTLSRTAGASQVAGDSGTSQQGMKFNFPSLLPSLSSFQRQLPKYRGFKKHLKQVEDN